MLMRKLLGLAIIVFIMGLGFTLITEAGVTTWTGEYFNNQTLTGNAKFVREDSGIWFDWGTGSPGNGLGIDSFSVRWTRSTYFTGGQYRFNIASDDGVRVFIDGQKVIDRWYGQEAVNISTDVQVSAGFKKIIVEYYEGGGKAKIQFNYQRSNSVNELTAAPTYAAPTYYAPISTISYQPQPTATPSIHLQIPPVTNSNWRGEYYNNKELAGTPVFMREATEIDYDWGAGSPDARIEPNYFSVRWTRPVEFAEGSYRFSFVHDDGVRLWINNQLVFDRWSAPTGVERDLPESVDVYIPTGTFVVRLEYFENTGDAKVQLSWYTIDAPTPEFQWRAEYYPNPNLSGLPIVRTDAQINFNWESGSPMPGQIPADNFSVRWTGKVYFTGGRYRFTTYTDDGVRLRVNGQKVIDEWRAQRGVYSAEIYVPMGYVDVEMEYYDYYYEAIAVLKWQNLGESTPVPPSSNANEVSPSLPPSDYWLGQYYSNKSLQGSPTLTRNDPEINFGWGDGSADPKLPADNFSVRWSRTFTFEPGRYRFIATADEGVRLWVNNRLLINFWYDDRDDTKSAEIDLPASPVVIRMEYYDSGGNAEARLGWEKK